VKTKLHLKPGENGTKRLLEKYGDRLICVRYRYDEEKKRRYKTIELVIEDKEWHPKNGSPLQGHKPSEMLGIRIDYFEKELQAQVKQAGGIWRPRHKLWELPYVKIVELGLEERIVSSKSI